MMAAKLEATDVLNGPAAKCGEADAAVDATLGQGSGVSPAVDGRAVYPIVTVVLEVCIEILQIDVRCVADAVVEGTAETPAVAEVTIVAQVIGAGVGRPGLGVVDTFPIEVVRGTEEKAKFFALEKALSDGAVKLIFRTAAKDGSIATGGLDVDRGDIFGAFGAQVDGAADAIAFHVGLQSFVDLHRLNEVGGDQIELDLTDGLRRGNVDAVEGGVGEARLRAAHFDVFPFTLVPLKGDTGKTADRIGDVSVRETGDNICRQDVNDVVRGKGAIDGSDLTTLPAGVDVDVLGVGSDSKHGIKAHRWRGDNKV